MTRTAPVVLAGVVLLGCRPVAPAQDKTLTETQKIEALLKHVEGLKDAKFVRNGTEYDAAAAAKFLRGKWDADKADIKTAKDFIEKAATKSSTSGRPYLIRLPGAKEMPSAEYLTDRLKEIEKSPAGKRDQ